MTARQKGTSSLLIKLLTRGSKQENGHRPVFGIGARDVVNIVIFADAADTEC